MLSEKLDKDVVFLDYFNHFLSSPAFTIHLTYQADLKDFTIKDDGTGMTPSSVEDGCQHKFLVWIEKERYQPFLQSRMFLEYCLCMRLIKEFNEMLESASKPSPCQVQAKRRRSKTTPMNIVSTDQESAPFLPSIESLDVSNESHHHLGHPYVFESVFKTVNIMDVIGKVSGMNSFKQFLVNTRGCDLINIWLDIEELSRLHSVSESEGHARNAPIHPWSEQRSFMELKYSHLLSSEEGKFDPNLLQCQSFEKLKAYWLPRYLLQIFWTEQGQIYKKDHLPMLQYQSTSVIRTHWNEEDYIQQMESFVAGLYLESQAGRHLLHYFVKNDMIGLSKMLLFWQSIEELKVLEQQGLESTSVDRLAWVIFKTFIAEGGSHALPITIKDRSEVLMALKEDHATTRSNCFSKLQKLCLFSLKRAWSSYLRSNYDSFLHHTVRTPPPPKSPSPIPPTPPTSKKSKDKRRKKKKKKQARRMMRDNSGLGSEEVDYLPEIQTLMKQKPSNASIRTSRISRSYTSNKGYLKQLSEIDPLGKNIEASSGPFSIKLQSFRKCLERKDQCQQAETCVSFVKHLDFCLEVQKLKFMIMAGTGVLIVQGKIEAIIDCYLDMDRPPWMLVSIPEHIIKKLAEVVSYPLTGFISTPNADMIQLELEQLEWAKNIVMAKLLPLWPEFLVNWTQEVEWSEKDSSSSYLGSSQKLENDSLVGQESSKNLACHLPPVIPEALPDKRLKISYSLTTGTSWARSSSPKREKEISEGKNYIIPKAKYRNNTISKKIE